MQLFEFVPNISEGKDKELINEFEKNLKKILEIKLLHIDSNEDANRSVFTIIGTENGILEATKCIFKIAKENISLENHIGAHPRIGIVDVCPIIPYYDSKMEDAKNLADKVGAIINDDFGIPVYFYENSAKETHKKNLKDCRKGGYEGLKEKIKDPKWQPDLSIKEVDKYGISVVGARDFLIAYNITIDAKNIDDTKEIANNIRNGKNKFKYVNILGWHLEKENKYQISTNIKNFRVEGLKNVFERVKEECKKKNIKILSSEIIGMVPKDAILNIEKDLMLDDKFDGNKKIIENVFNSETFIKILENEKTKIKHWKPESKPRERLEREGANSLSPKELLAILVGTGSKKMNVMTLCNKIMDSVGHSFLNLSKLRLEDFTKNKEFSGIGKTKAITILAVLEIARRFNIENVESRVKIKKPMEIFEAILPYIKQSNTEDFYIIVLNTANTIIHVEKLFSGGINTVIVDIRVILQLVLIKGGTGFVMAHNHPSGKLEPSELDIKLTNEIKEACVLLKIRLFDHIIIGDNKYYSFLNEGLL